MARGQSRGFRMRKHWIGYPGIRIALTGNATFLGSVALDPGDAGTVLRMLGSYVIGPSSATVSNDAAEVAVGIGVFNLDALAVGATALPEPGAEPEFPWLYWACHAFHFAGTNSDPNSLASSLRTSYDSKSMRKFKPGEGIVMVGEYLDVNGNPPLTFVSSVTRVLVAH